MQKLFSLSIKENNISNQKMLKTFLLSLPEYVLFKNLDILKKKHKYMSLHPSDH